MDRVSKITTFDQLPFSFTFPKSPNLKIRVDRLRQEHIPKLKVIWEKSSSTGDGISNEEVFEYFEENVIKKDISGYKCYVLVDESSEDLILISAVFPSNLCRSEKPVHCGSFFIVNDAYRGQQVALNVMKSFDGFTSASGYSGVLARTSVMSRSIIPAVMSGAVYIGVIPWCSYMEGRGWFHDLIIHEKVKEFDLDASSRYKFPMLGDKKALEATLPMFKRLPTSRTLPSIHHKLLGNLSMDSANSDGIWTAQDILREAAMEGDGLGLDEFTANGIFNEKHILNCRYWLVRSVQDGKVVAIVLSGEDGHGRSHNKHKAAGLIVVVKQFRQQGLGGQLLRYCEEHSAVFGYKYILMDVLACNMAGLALMRKRNFIITGTIPDSCLVRDQVGYTVTSTGSNCPYQNCEGSWATSHK